MRRYGPWLILLAISLPARGGSVAPYTSIYIRTLLDDETKLLARTTLGLGEDDFPAFAGLDLVNLVLEFSVDTTFADDSDSAVPTEKAVKKYVDDRMGPGPGNIVWRELRYDFTLMKKGASPPGEESEAIGASGNIDVYNYAFDPGGPADEEVFWHTVIPTDIDESRNIQLFLGWFPDSGWGSGEYRWVVEYLVYDADDAYGATLNRTVGAPTVIYEDVTPANATDFIQTPFYDPNTIDANANQIIFFRLFLDASESEADNDAHVLYAMLQYASNTPGPTLGARMLYENGNVMVLENGAIMIFE